MEMKIITSVDIGEGLEVHNNKLRAKETTVKEHALQEQDSIPHNGDVQMVFVNGKLLMSTEYEITETQILFNEPITGTVSTVSGNIIFKKD